MERDTLKKVVSFFFSVVFLVSAPVAASQKSKLTKQAEIEYAKANYDKAYSLFKKAIQSGDTKGEPRFFLGLIVETRRKYRESIEYFRDALQRSLPKKYRTVALWKVILYLKQTRNYPDALDYAQQLNKIIGANRKLNEIIEEAELNVSPVYIEGQKILREAIALETEFLKDKAHQNFWEKHQPKIIEVANIYEILSNMDERYRKYLWKSAYYYENTYQFENALRNYQSILKFDPDNIGATYKIGIIYKKQMKYQDAEVYLKKVYKKENSKPIMNFYTAINLSQIYYFLKTFSLSNEFARFALGKEYSKYRSQSQKSLLRLLLCNTNTPLQVILTETNLKKLKSLRKMDKTCFSPANRWQKLGDMVTRKTQIEYILSRLLYAKQNHLNYLVSGEIKYFEAVEDNYILAFLSEEIDTVAGENMVVEETNSSIPKKAAKIAHEKSTGFITHIIYQEELQDWPLAELGALASYLYQKRSYSTLYNILSKYDYILESEDQFHRWLAHASFQEEEYHTSTKAYLQIRERSLSEEKKLLLGYSFLEKWYDLGLQINSYLDSAKEDKAELISFVNSEPALESFRNQGAYKDLIKKFQAKK